MRKKIIVGGVCAALATAAACSSETGTASGTETLTGALSSNSQILPITATGPISDHGSLNIGSSGTAAAFDLSKGKLDVTHSNPVPSTTMTANCLATSVMEGTYTVTGGTGAYAHATGHGTYDITTTEQFAKANGACPNPNGNASPVSGKLTFRAAGPLTG